MSVLKYFVKRIANTDHYIVMLDVTVLFLY